MEEKLCFTCENQPRTTDAHTERKIPYLEVNVNISTIFHDEYGNTCTYPKESYRQLTRDIDIVDSEKYLFKYIADVLLVGKNMFERKAEEQNEKEVKVD